MLPEKFAIKKIDSPLFLEFIQWLPGNWMGNAEKEAHYGVGRVEKADNRGNNTFCLANGINLPEDFPLLTLEEWKESITEKPIPEYEIF